jgi:hypothetical protein
MENQLPSNRTANANSFLAAASARLGWRTLLERLQSLWLGLILLAIVAAGFTLSYFVYARLTAHSPGTSVETYGE